MFNLIAFLIQTVLIIVLIETGNKEWGWKSRQAFHHKGNEKILSAKQY